MNLEDIMGLLDTDLEPHIVVAALKRGATSLQAAHGEEDSPIILRNLAKAIVDRITPEEPTGVGATVRDDEGHIAIRNRTGGRWDWWITDIGWCEWGKDFTVSTEEQILSHGVRMGP